MRVATYAVPGAKGAEAGECAVFFFGPGQGGGVDDNVARWAKQFEGAPAADDDERTVVGGAAGHPGRGAGHLPRARRADDAVDRQAAGLPAPRRDRRGAGGERLLQAHRPRGHRRRRAGASFEPSSPPSGGGSRVPLRAAVFDFDGVIVDSEPLHFRSLRDALRPEGVEITEEEYLHVYLAFDDREAIRLALEHHGERPDPARVGADRGAQGRALRPADPGDPRLRRRARARARARGGGAARDRLRRPPRRDRGDPRAASACATPSGRSWAPRTRSGPSRTPPPTSRPPAASPRGRPASPPPTAWPSRTRWRASPPPSARG